MAADFTKPITADLRAAVLQSIRDMQIALVKMLDGETLTGTPTNAIRYNSSTSRFEKWNGTTWNALPLNFLPLAGGTLTGALTGTSGAFTSLTVNGSAVWHAGNFTPSSKLDATATAVRAGGVATVNSGIGQGAVWVTSADMLFNNGTANRTVWHDGNFNPATKQDASSAWHTGNFNPATKQDAASAWHTGNFNPANYAPLSGAAFTGNVSSSTYFSAPTLNASGASAIVTFANRDDLTKSFSWYATGNAARLYHSANGDRVTVTAAGAMTVADSITAGANITAYSDRRLKENILYRQPHLEGLLAVAPVSYNKIGDDRRSVGLIAQDVQQVMPEVVQQDDNGMLSLDYGRFAAVAVVSLARELRARGVI